MSIFQTEIPNTDKDIRRRIYDGDIFVLPPNKIRSAFAKSIEDRLESIFDGKAQFIHNVQDDFMTLDQLADFKSALTQDQECRISLRAILIDLGLTPHDYAIDIPRLRANIPSGYKNSEAEVAYAAHRDTWYSNPKSQINFWIPIYDVNERQSFAFYPDYFDKPVKNNSAEFDYDSWIAHGHPTTHEDLKNPISFSAPAGSLVLFSAAHLHQGLGHDEETIRYSIDFRAVHGGDFEKNIGAPDPDNDSRPHAFNDYIENGI